MAERVLTETLISSESANNLSDAAERLFARILATPTTDAWGRRDAALRKLRADCIPLLDWSDTKLMQSLEELVREGMCELYCIDGRYYLRVCNWDLYQRAITRLRRGQSRFPDPPLPDGVDNFASGERAANERRAIGGRPGLICGSNPVVIQPSDAQSVQSAAEAEIEDSAEGQEQEPESLGWFLTQVPGANGRTAAAVSTLVRKYRLPEAALHSALEEMRAGGGAIRNKPGLVVAKLKEYGESGRYAR
jgi:hypothetical protein